MGNCLDGLMCGDNILIGIRGYTTSSISPLSINDLPGISIKTAASTVPDELVSGYQLLKEKIIFGTKLVLNDLKQHVTPYFSINNIADSDNSGEWGDYFNAYTAANRGLKIKRINSNFAKIMIKELRIFGQTNISTNVTITDGAFTYTYPVDLVANQEVLLPINDTFESDEIIITLPNNAISLRTGSINDTFYCSTCHGKKRGSMIVAYGWDGSQTTSYLYGIRAKAVLVCDDSDIFCDLINKMDMLVLYRSGIEVYKELLLSNRLNPVTLFNKETVKEALPNLQAEYDTMMKTFKETIKQYLNHKKDVCISCKSDRYTYTTP